MTTEQIGTLAPGESADDLVAELDSLLASVQCREISLEVFAAEVLRIDALVEARLGAEPEEPAPHVSPDCESTPEEDAYDIWCGVRAAAVNRYVPWNEVERELDAELGGGLDRLASEDRR